MSSAGRFVRHHKQQTDRAIRLAYVRLAAEPVALGAFEELIAAVLATQIGADLRNAQFWRTVWTFLIANARAIAEAQVGPLIDFVHAIRHESIAIETPHGIVMRDPPQPSFSMRGRTTTSMVRLMQEWHRSVGRIRGGLTWEPAPLQPMLKKEPGHGCHPGARMAESTGIRQTPSAAAGLERPGEIAIEHLNRRITVRESHVRCPRPNTVIGTLDRAARQ